MKKFYPVTAIKAKLHDYKLRHLRIGKVKNLKKDGYTDFKIVNISLDDESLPGGDHKGLSEVLYQEHSGDWKHSLGRH